MLYAANSLGLFKHTQHISTGLTVIFQLSLVSKFPLDGTHKEKD